MEKSAFVNFEEGLSKYLPNTINEILKAEQDKKVYGIGFITTDDFYGFYITYDYTDDTNNCDIYEYYEWQYVHKPMTDYLYQPLVDIVDSAVAIDFTRKSDEKWEFGLVLLAVLAEHIKQIPDEVFKKNNYNREDIVFFSTMSDGDYMSEMFSESLKMFNDNATVEKYGFAN